VAEGSRRLSAVMLTDLVGYTSLTQRDEAAALRVLEEHRGIVRPLLSDHSGREVKTIGDAFLVEFDNALDAARCAIAIQRALHERNSRTPGARVELRIGLHVGDVVHQNGDIYGDAVNLVSRVEPLAEPGGICLSGAVYDQVRNKIALPLAPMGATSLKNVEVPVHLYRVELPWSVTSLARETPWVSRPTEQETLRQAVERAGRGEGSVVLLVGESGIGKTRLADETIRSAEKVGFRALRGRAFPGELATPYSHWVGMVREFLHDAPPQLVYKVSGTVAGEVAKLVPELTEKVGPTPPSPSGDAESARARFYEGVTQFFLNVAKEDPLLLLFDDLQWADPASLRLLQYAAQSVSDHRLLLLGTYQAPGADPASPLEEVVRDLRKNRLLTTVSVPRMDRGSVGTMIEKTFGEIEVSEEFRALVHERTGGNPFFVEEVLRSLVEEGAIYRTEAAGWERKEIEEIGIPKTVRDVVKQRFNRLDEPTQATLRVAAVLGVEFPVEILREVAGVDEERLIEQLERVVRVGLLEERRVASRLLAFSFTDPQLREILYDEMLSLRRVRYHRRAAESLEKLAGNRREEFATDLAYHFREGQEATKARDYSVLAAEQWAKVYGFDEAERRYRTALELLEEAPDNRVRARLLDGLGRTHHALGRSDLAVGEWEAAIRLYEAGDEARKAGWLCRELADLVRLRPDLAPGTPGRIEELLEAGRRLLESVPPSRELAMLYGVWSMRLHEQGRTLEARAMVEKALEVSRAIGDRDAEMSMYDELATVVPLGEKEKLLEYLERKEQYFSRPGREDWEQVHQARHNLSYASLRMTSDASGAIRWAERSVEAARKARNKEWEATARLGPLLTALLWVGDARRIEEELRRVRELLALSPDSRNVAFGLRSGEFALLRGDLQAAALHLSSIEASPGGGVWFMWTLLRVRLHREQGEPGEAIRLLREAIARERGPVTELAAYDALHWLRLRATLAEILIEEPEESLAPEEIARLARELHEVASRLGNPFGLGLDQRVQGRLARHENRLPEAIARGEEEVGWFRKAGNPFELAETLRDLAERYQDSGQPERAHACRQESSDLLSRLRAPGANGGAVRLASRAAKGTPETGE
jgi:class 3 adenylate cyclase/tetratricopeptide (TPR) repeat protein